jgi:hypothetical protein
MVTPTHQIGDREECDLAADSVQRAEAARSAREILDDDGNARPMLLSGNLCRLVPASRGAYRGYGSFYGLDRPGHGPYVQHCEVTRLGAPLD